MAPDSGTFERLAALKTMVDPARETLIRETVARREAWATPTGALATWTSPESTGRCPQDTFTVRRPQSEGTIDWDSPNNLPIDPTTFDMLLEDALAALEASDTVFETRRALGADPHWALPFRTFTDKALTALFTQTMFRPVPAEGFGPVFRDRPFTLLALPDHKLDPERYAGRLRTDPTTGCKSSLAIAMDYDRRIGIVHGSAYLGTVKKLGFTVMNYYLPPEGILPIHCAANEGPDGDVALMLGLSGTGKTTLSADPRRKLLGDDEHGWGDRGVANFEYGCYAKLIGLDPTREPEIFRAVFHQDDWQHHGAIVENAFMLPSGRFDLCDDRLTQNSRAAYPLTYLSNIKPLPVAGHPRTIVFLAADANGVLPPIARLDRAQAMLWFLMGYTSKLAGTETGVVEPKSTFSRFFGGPFMPRNPADYADMLGRRMTEHQTDVYLVNTGWSGGPYGEGRRMDIRLTRLLLNAALNGSLRDAPVDPDPWFHIGIPRSCPGLDDPSILNPRNTWADPLAFDARATALAREFQAHFVKAYGGKGLAPEIEAACPRG
jgi:phosphoenolpyruvate carboxykinase (ATP)